MFQSWSSREIWLGLGLMVCVLLALVFMFMWIGARAEASGNDVVTNSGLHYLLYHGKDKGLDIYYGLDFEHNHLDVFGPGFAVISTEVNPFASAIDTTVDYGSGTSVHTLLERNKSDVNHAGLTVDIGLATERKVSLTLVVMTNFSDSMRSAARLV